jgi:hypothetical protein
MESKPTQSRAIRFRLRTLLVVVALVGLFVAFVARELHLRNELQRERARAAANLQKARAAMDQYFTVVAQQSVAGGHAQDELRRHLLQQTLKFYEGAESKASTSEERTKIRNRAQRLRTRLATTDDHGKQ